MAKEAQHTYLWSLKIISKSRLFSSFQWLSRSPGSMRCICWYLFPLIHLWNEAKPIFYLAIVYFYLLLVETFNLCKNESERLFIPRLRVWERRGQRESGGSFEWIINISIYLLWIRASDPKTVATKMVICQLTRDLWSLQKPSKK